MSAVERKSAEGKRRDKSEEGKGMEVWDMWGGARRT